MPTKQWFEENPKVTAYISKELHQKLETFMAEEGYKKVSQAITAILEERLSGKKQSRDNDLRQEVAQLRAKVDQHETFMFKIIQGGLKEALPVEESQVLSGNRYNQLTLEEAQPEGRPKVEQSKPAPKVIQGKPKRQELTTKEVEGLIGISRKKLEYKKKTGNLPYTDNGYTVTQWLRKETKQPYNNIWEVQEASSN